MSRDIETLLKIYYNSAGDDKKNWKEGEQWSTERQREKLRKNALYNHFSMLDSIINELKTASRNKFQWTQIERKHARQMIKCLNFERRNENKIIVSVIVLTKLSLNNNRQLYDYDKLLLQQYNVSHDFVLKTSMQLHKDYTMMNLESVEFYEGQSVDYDENGNVFLSHYDKRADSIEYGDDYISNDYSDSENFDYS